MRSDRLAQSHRQPRRLGCGRVGYQNDKFLAAPACQQIGLANQISSNTGQLDQGLITGLMAVGIVYLLEVIDIVQDQTKYRVHLCRPRYFSRQRLIEFQAVAHPGQRIGRSLHLQRASTYLQRQTLRQLQVIAHQPLRARDMNQGQGERQQGDNDA